MAAWIPDKRERGGRRRMARSAAEFEESMDKSAVTPGAVIRPGNAGTTADGGEAGEETLVEYEAC